MINNLVQRLVLGTAQFGLDYGISNSKGKVNQTTVNEILTQAHNIGIKFLDTATAYGDSEAAIGKSDLLYRQFRIISKCPKEKQTKKQIFESIDQSINNLNVNKLYGYLAHDFQSIQSKEFYSALNEIKTLGKASKVGVSVYYPWQVEWILENVEIDLIQLPFNLFDRRFKYLFPEMKQRNIEVHVRSVFLQGLFFLPDDKLNGHFAKIKSHIRELKAIAKRHEISTPEILLNYCLAERLVDKVVIGVTSINELLQNVNSLNKYQMIKERKIIEHLRDFEIFDESILIPSKWLVL